MIAEEIVELFKCYYQETYMDGEDWEMFELDALLEGWR